MGVVRRVVAVLVFVGLCGGLPGGSVAAQETAAPGRVGSLADQVVTVGETLDVDVAEAFSGTVSAYAAVSSNPAVVSVSVEGSVVTLRGVARGYAYVRVTATNAAGSATQAITVDTELAEPPPQLARLLGSESTTVGAIAAFDLTPVFSGRVVSYGATSSDTAILDASVDGSIVILRGAGVGSATATVSATNLGGTESTSFTVTVGAARTPVAPPAATEEGLTATRLAVGTTLDVDVSGAFTGTVNRNLVVPDDRGVVTSPRSTPETIRLAGVAGGSTTARVVAVNAGGIAAQTLDITVTDPTKVAVAATAPTHCLTGEGTPITRGNTTARTGIATIDITYTITDGTPPYTITSPDALATATTTAASGTLTVACARTGINPNNVHPTANAVESGPKTITLTVTDTNGRTNTTNTTTQIVEDAYTTEYSGGTMQQGNTYVIGDSDDWAFITLPTGLNLKFDGVTAVEGQFETGRFKDSVSSSEIGLDWHTGSEVYRHIVGGTSTTDGTGDSSMPMRDVSALFDALVRSAVSPDGIAYDGGNRYGGWGNFWRPYPGLPLATHVLVHESMLKGQTLIVCNAATVGDFYTADFADSETLTDRTASASDLKDDFDDAFDDAISDWNLELHRMTGDDGTPHEVFRAVTRASNCDGTSETSDDNAAVDIIVHRRTTYTQHSCAQTDETERNNCLATHRARHFVELRQPMKCEAAGGCARITHMGNSRMMSKDAVNDDGDTVYYTRHTIITRSDSTRFRSTIAHELGHFLGFGDYKNNCPRGSDDKTLFTYTKPDRCRTPWDSPVGARDLEDIHHIYHPDELLGVEIQGGSVRGRLPLGTAGNFEFNAQYLVAWSRPAGSDVDYTYVGSVAVHNDAGIIDPSVADGDFTIPLEGVNPAGREFLVAGVTRGDHRRLFGSPDPWTARWEVTVGDRGSQLWTLGDPEVVFGPAPGVPQNVVASAGSNGISVAWDAITGAQQYKVFWGEPGSGTLNDAGNERIVLAEESSPSTFVELTAEGTYYFWVQAFAGPLRGAHSASAAATFPQRGPVVVPEPPATVPPTPDLRAIQDQDVTHRSVRLSWGAVSPATSYNVQYRELSETSWTDVVLGRVTSYTVRGRNQRGLAEQTTYVFRVQAVNGSAVSTWSAPQQRRTASAPATVVTSGQLAVRLIPERLSGSDLEFGFNDQTDIIRLPGTRFLDYDRLGTNWIVTSIIRGVTEEGILDLGRIRVRRTANDDDHKFELQFVTVAGVVVEPRYRIVAYRNMQENNWLRSSVIVFTVPNAQDATPVGSARAMLEASPEFESASPDSVECGAPCADDSGGNMSPG